MKKNKTIDQLTADYNNTVRALIDKFLIKMGYEENGVPFEYECIKENLYNLIFVGDLFISLDDIIYDLFNDVPKGTFIKWYDYNLGMTLSGYHSINYHSYLCGYRHTKRSKYREFIYRQKNRIRFFNDHLNYTIIKNLKKIKNETSSK